MRIHISLESSTDEDLRTLSKMFSVLGASPTTIASAHVPTPGEEFVSIIAPPMAPPPLREPATPASPELRAKLDELKAQPPGTAKAPEEPVAAPRGPGRPKGRKNDIPVPRPDSGAYGAQERDPAVWAATKARMQQVVVALEAKGFAPDKWLTKLSSKYGDGTFSTVPVGNYEAMLADAVQGPKECPLTAADLEAAQQEIERQAAQKVTAQPAGVTS